MEHGTHIHDAAVVSVRSLAAENRRLRRRLGQLEREKAQAERVVAVAAHELVVPLIATEAYASVVTDRLQDEIHADSRSDLDALRRGTAHARLLVDTLLHNACANERPLQRRAVDLNVVVSECLTLLAPELRFREANARVATLPVVSGEETLLQALFTNLLSNGLKYGPRHGGEIGIDATLLRDGWRFCVSSQGSRIPVEDRERIFDAYRRGRDERRVRGAGLGLAICRHIVERHGGRIWVGAARGGGNRFCFTLPA
jgi:signal transduction histidine kinase